MSSQLALLPPVHLVDRYLKECGLAHGTEARGQVEAALAALRADPGFWAAWDRERILAWIAEQVARPQGLRRVLNATGTIVHTNLGRSPFAPHLLERLPQIFGGYCNLEYDLERGQRGQRVAQAERLLCQLTGAQGALFVNNNASALLLTLQAFAQGREVLLSRGEMVEIGGSFRIPEMLQASGAKLKELGTTNKTHLKDYQNAASGQTALLLKVHRSNFKITGFTAEPSRKELVALAEERGWVYLEDLGSGSLETLQIGPETEPGLASILRQGAHLVTASGDKLLGGPQAGLILGRKDLIERLKRHPLYRCLRCDKITLYLLEQTLLAYARGDLASVPTHRMLTEAPETTRHRAERLARLLKPLAVELAPSQATPGGGALPEAALESWALALPGPAEELHRKLRTGEPPLIGRIKEDRLLLDVKTLQEDELELAARLVRRALEA